ncbi:Uncharacterised protein [Mycobacteroides abscessus subsp. bolletii]|uniref:hypothetical protein n=1 Tax=Mycobacteroides abscessus TaxID=36809 RepID=UPI00092B46B3|nr:hypothetical protein [Mycobacteroides abscessus]SHQ64427.1 Uncharacterised protein [Mycobacteroides abscessus subsp. bolletii]SHS47951.1 Uncharacterised protein [Mycobacteroides abscessus subsp. bolletii]SHT06938.1 Uncharacterised protein [Mycobacteroides abscessus subsp. bolletii]SHT15091.1 Uncharacterised protein [Mycobacteroides abscessus subsp. bolletii]SHY50342.1 Uncharacterised protein [Mycobacteroides abscessus subsp. bolletii]
MDDTSGDMRVVFTAAIVSAVAYGALASFYVARGGLDSATIYLTILGLFVALPIIGLALAKLLPRLRDYAHGVMLAPLPGALTYLLATLWIAIT